jgi:multisubunit Na+/H+ antiporter MnhC subunit
MGDLLRQFFLSDVVLFGLMGVVMLLISAWAYSTREYAGYILGWLLGVLTIILISVFSIRIDSGGDVPPMDVVQAPFIFLSLIIATLTGLGGGFVGLGVTSSDRYRESRVQRALAVAVTTGFTLASGYFMLLSDYTVRLVIVVFTLSLAIGALLSYIFSGRRSRQVATPADIVAEPVFQDEMTVQSADPDAFTDHDLPSPLAQRIHNIRSRVRRYR